MEGEAGLREALNAHRTLGLPATVGKFPSVQALRLAMVVTKQPAKTLSTCDPAIRGADLFSWVDKSSASP